MRIHTFKYIINNRHFYLKKIELEFAKEQITVKDDLRVLMNHETQCST